MDFKQIQELLRLMSKSDLSELRIEQENFKITLKKGSYNTGDGAHGTYIPHAVQPIAQHVAASNTTAINHDADAEPVAAAPKPAEGDATKMHTIKSPMIGTFYRSSGPDKEPFVKVGDIVRTGNVLCIIEAMKLFNEIEAEVSGKVVKFLVEDASPVEYDQPLFIIDTSEI